MLYVGTTGHYSSFGEAEFGRPEDGGLTRRLEQIGAPGVEIFMEGPAWTSIPAGVPITRRLLHGFGGPRTLHAPAWDVNIAAYRPQERAVAVQLMTQAVEAGAELAAEHVVIHPFVSATPDVDGHRDRYALESISVLGRRAETVGIRLVIENLPEYTRPLGSRERYFWLIDRLPASARPLLDLGHAHVNGWDIAETIRRLGDRLDAIHLHDNGGSSDEHRPVGAGTIPWERVFEALGDAAPHCRWITEYLRASDDVLREHVPMLLAKQHSLRPSPDDARRNET